ncbi:hypothetical protein [Saccharicrinis sp. FJH54]|uniref:hypothetical protein n=1 Tax=Saccharicrinis sp. FJH54 TaxID=3344665 RepID=UPI0035D4745D
MIRLYVIISLFLGSVLFVNAQTINLITKRVQLNDSVLFKLDSFTGSVNWQKSVDSVNWISISENNSDTFMFIADQTAYFRAFVTVGSCEPFISEIAKIIVLTNSQPWIPELLYPVNNSSDQGLFLTLKWKCSDPDGDDLSYDVYFDDADASTLVTEDHSDTTWTTGSLNFNTTYYWKVIANDNNGNLVSSEVWSFTTLANLAPEQPELLAPANNSTTGINALDLKWRCSDPDGDDLSYDVYFDDADASTLVTEDHSDTTWTTGSLNFNTTYYWKVIANDNNGNLVSSEVWSFTTLANLAPEQPELLAPANNSTTGINALDLKWRCSDPEGDDLSYDVYFDDADASTLVSENQNDTTWSTGSLLLNTTYFWKIIAKDSNGNLVSSEIWTFTFDINPHETFEEADAPETFVHEGRAFKSPWGYNKPENASRLYPILVSGMWGDGERNYQAVAKDFPAFVIDYQKPSETDGQILGQWIKSALQAGYHIDVNRIYYIGFSYGGSSSYPLAKGMFAENMFFAAIIRMAGQSQSDLGNDIAQQTAVWYHIGLNDEPIRVQVARDALEYMNNYPCNNSVVESTTSDNITGYERNTIILTRNIYSMFVYSEYTGMGHTSIPCFLDQTLFPWLFNHSLDFR